MSRESQSFPGLSHQRHRSHCHVLVLTFKLASKEQLFSVEKRQTVSLMWVGHHISTLELSGLEQHEIL